MKLNLVYHHAQCFQLKMENLKNFQCIIGIFKAPYFRKTDDTATNRGVKNAHYLPLLTSMFYFGKMTSLTRKVK